MSPTWESSCRMLPQIRQSKMGLKTLSLAQHH